MSDLICLLLLLRSRFLSKNYEIKNCPQGIEFVPALFQVCNNNLALRKVEICLKLENYYT